MPKPTIQEQIDYISKSKMAVAKLASVTPTLFKDVALLIAVEETLSAFKAIVDHANHIGNNKPKSNGKAKKL